MKTKEVKTTSFISKQASDGNRNGTITFMKDLIEYQHKCKVVDYSLIVVDPRNGFKPFFPAEVYDKAQKMGLIGIVMTAKIEKVKTRKR